MLHEALVAPSLRWTVMGAAIAAAIAVMPPEHPGAHRYMLTLSAPPPTEKGTIYLSVFEDGDVTFATDYDGLFGLRFETTAWLSDGCKWLGYETLEPADATHYTYTYDEEILECRDGARPGIKTPREGIVTVEPYGGHSTRFMMWKP